MLNCEEAPGRIPTGRRRRAEGRGVRRSLRILDVKGLLNVVRSVFQLEKPLRCSLTIWRSRFASRLSVRDIAVARDAWQSTFGRQAQNPGRHGFAINRQTLVCRMSSATFIAKGLYDLKLKRMHGFCRLFYDETPMPVLDPGRARTRPASSGRDGRTNMAGPSAAVICSQAGATRRKMPRNWPASKACARVGYCAYCLLPSAATIPDIIRLADCLVHALFNFVKVHKATNSLFVRELGRTPMRSTGRQIGGGFTNQSAEPDQRDVLSAMLVPLHGLTHRRHSER